MSTDLSGHSPHAHADPFTDRMVIIGCSARKATAPGPLPALELYDGGCVPPLRTRLGDNSRLRARVRILSAEHGLVTADTLLHTYDRPLDPDRAVVLRPAVMSALRGDMAADGVPHEILIVVEPLYLVLLADLLALPARPRLYWIPDPAHGWPQASAVLDQWGW